MNQEIKSQIKQCSELYDMNSIFLQEHFLSRMSKASVRNYPNKKSFFDKKEKINKFYMWN